MCRRLAINFCFGVLMLWKVWYDDGSGLSLYHSDRDKWGSIPLAAGVQVVLVCEDKDWKPGYPYRRLLRGSDWYGWRGGELHLDDSWGSGAHTGKWVDPPALLLNPRRGLTIPTERFDLYVQQAREDARCSVP